MPASRKTEHFSEPYQNLLILCDIFQQFPPLCKCLPAIWFKQMPRLHSTTTGMTFYLVCFLIFICVKQNHQRKTPEDNIGFFFRERMKEMGFVDNPTHSRDQKCVFRLDITPRWWNVAACPHAVAPNSVFLHPLLLCHVSFLHQRSHWESSKLRLPAACTVLHSSTTSLLLWLLGHINLAGLRSEAGAGITVHKESQAEREGTKDQRNRAPIVQKCTSPATGWAFCARPPSSSERGIAKSTWNRLRVACAGTEMALED